MKTLSTVDQIIAALDGNAAAAKLLGVSIQQISNMRAAGRMPPKHHLAISNAIGDQYRLAPGIFRPRKAA